MFEIVNEEKKQIVISLHLEQIYTEMRLKNHIGKKTQLFSIDTLGKSCIDYLVELEVCGDKYSDYEYIIDFTHIKYIIPNSEDKFILWLNNLPKIKVCHCGESDFGEVIKKYNIVESDKIGYRGAFNDYGKKYIVTKCLDSKGYTTQTGIQLGIYIDLKKIINDSMEMLRWCYIIAFDLDSYFMSVGEDPSEKTLLFCHTMNGTYIAGILSQLLGDNLVYVDHLGPYNKLNKVDFYKGKSRSEEFIIIADMVCQGNEFLRAKNIVEYLGGSVRGCAGILKMEISNLLTTYDVDVFAIRYTSEEATKELGYTIRTQLCSSKCEECKRKEM